MKRWTALAAALLALSGCSLSAGAQRPAFSERTDRWLEDCRRGRWNDAREHVCDVRDETIPASRSLSVDSRENGSITVHGWDQANIRVVSRLHAYADTEREAREIASEIRLETAGGDVRSRGPRRDRWSGWSVSYEIWVPRTTELELRARNGGLSVTGVNGRMDLATVNGGLSLREVGGHVRGRTTNGGVTVELDGQRWRGEGLEVRTTNGSVTLVLPNGYSADLETGTVNGSFYVDFPITVQGTVGRRLRTQLGQGGPPIAVTTTNGAVRIRRS